MDNFAAAKLSMAKFCFPIEFYYICIQFNCHKNSDGNKINQSYEIL